MRALSICLVLSLGLFTIGMAGVLLRKNLVTLLMSVQVMLLGVLMALVTFSRAHAMQQGLVMNGQVMALALIAWAAMQVSVGIALCLSLYRSIRETPELDSFGEF